MRSLRLCGKNAARSVLELREIFFRIERGCAALSGGRDRLAIDVIRHVARRNPAAWYRTVFRKAGLTQIAPYVWAPDGVRVTLSELESARR